MVLQVTKGSGFWNDYTSSGYGWHCLFEFAKALSAHAGWNIIDSYAPGASPQRVNGDPFSGGLWGGLNNSAAQENAWAVFEQANPTGGRPSMQFKLQCVGAFALLDDPSGNDYGLETENRLLAIRFAPFGGWDLDPSTPDFANPTTKVTDNMHVNVGDGSDNGNWYFHIDDDHVIYLQYDVSDNEWHNMFYLGEYTPMFAGQDTPAHPAYMYFGGNAKEGMAPYFKGIATSDKQFISEDPTGISPYVWCPDENGEMQGWYGYCPPMGNGFIEASMCPNEFDPVVGVDLIEVLFSGLAISGSPDSRMIGSMKHIWRGWGIGNGGFIGAKQYLTLGANVSCAIVDWDGSTSL